MEQSNGHPESRGRGGSRPGAGRPPKPIEDHLVDGTWRKDRHGPQPKDDGPPPEADDLARIVTEVESHASHLASYDAEWPAPAHLDDYPAKFFRHIAPWILDTFGDAAAPRLELLTRACELLSTAKLAADAIRDGGLTFTTESGMQRQRPEIAIQREAICELRSVLHDIGILKGTP